MSSTAPPGDAHRYRALAMNHLAHLFLSGNDDQVLVGLGLPARVDVNAAGDAS